MVEDRERGDFAADVPDVGVFRIGRGVLEQGARLVVPAEGQERPNEAGDDLEPAAFGLCGCGQAIKGNERVSETGFRFRVPGLRLSVHAGLPDVHVGERPLLRAIGMIGEQVGFAEDQ